MISSKEVFAPDTHEPPTTTRRVFSSDKITYWGNGYPTILLQTEAHAPYPDCTLLGSITLEDLGTPPEKTTFYQNLSNPDTPYWQKAVDLGVLAPEALQFLPQAITAINRLQLLFLRDLLIVPETPHPDLIQALLTKSLAPNDTEKPVALLGITANHRLFNTIATTLDKSHLAILLPANGQHSLSLFQKVTALTLQWIIQKPYLDSSAEKFSAINQQVLVAADNGNQALVKELIQTRNAHAPDYPLLVKGILPNPHYQPQQPLISRSSLSHPYQLPIAFPFVALPRQYMDLPLP